MRKRFKQRKGDDSDDSFDSSDSANDSDGDDEQDADVDATPKARPLVEEFVVNGPSQLEQVVEAAKHVIVPLPKHAEEEDEIKNQLLKSNTEGDLSKDVAKVGKWVISSG